jgi:hypothetical protein
MGMGVSALGGSSGSGIDHTHSSVSASSKIHHAWQHISWRDEVCHKTPQVSANHDGQTDCRWVGQVVTVVLVD